MQAAAGAVFEKPAGAGGQDRALLGLVLGGIRQDDSAGGLLLSLEASHHDAITQRLDLHLDLLDRPG
jgi:hypothetical protein